MKKWLVLFLVFFAFSFQSGSAENWVSVGYDKDNYHWMYDLDTLLNDGTGHYTVTFAKVKEGKKRWYQGELSIMPMRRLYSLNRWEEHTTGKKQYSYWTYDYKLKSYTTNTMYDAIGKSILNSGY